MEHWLRENGEKCMCVKREQESRVGHLLRNCGETGEWRERWWEEDLMRVENIMLCGEALVEIEDWRRMRENSRGNGAGVPQKKAVCVGAFSV